MNDKYHFFRRGQTVVDLGYAPGSWSQVALDRTYPTGRVLGIDIIPAQPPKGVSTIQGNFLSEKVQSEVKRFLSEWDTRSSLDQSIDARTLQHREQSPTEQLGRSTNPTMHKSMSRLQKLNVEDKVKAEPQSDAKAGEMRGTVDVVLSDMSEPWAQTDGFFKKSLSDPYLRMMNTSGMSFRDHAGSMDLCQATLKFAADVLKTGGHLVCKFYSGSEDKLLERQLKLLFCKVHREKPESSRPESRESYFVALNRSDRPDQADLANRGC